MRRPSGGEGYVHQVDHDLAGLQAESVCFDVSSCENNSRQEVMAAAAPWQRVERGEASAHVWL